MRIAVFIIASAAILLFLNSCSGHGPYRYASEGCDEKISLGAVNEEGNYPDRERLSCMHQTHALASTYRLPAVHRGVPAEPDEFRLAFVELDRKISPHVRDAQLDAAVSSLKAGSQNYVVVFVHGWRHNADIGDSDIRKLRTLLAYARNFLNSRCVELARYCDARLTGIYLGWRGASVKEFGDDRKAIGTVWAAPTFWARKNESERLKDEALKVLSALQSRLTLRAGDSEADKMLVIGHSFGGNMLASALSSKVAAAVAQHETGSYFEAPIGDLTVLVNPASEASNWTRIQEAVAAKGGRSIVYPGQSGNDRFEQTFAPDQRPNYLAITSACNWSLGERSGTGSLQDVACDTATAYMFPLGQMAALKWDRERNRTIGHLDPAYEGDAKKAGLVVGSRRVGTSHEFVTNAGEGSATSFSAGSVAFSSRCDVADGWLTQARAAARSRSGHSDRQWDTGHGRNSILWVDRRRGITAQFRHGLSLPGFGTGQLASIAAANSPFWNVRAYDSAISLHSNFVNYPLWCSLNQLVLDDVAAGDP